MSSTEHPLHRVSQQTFKSSKCIKILERNCLFTAKFNFKISLQPHVVQSLIFKLNILLDQIFKNIPDQLAKILIFLKIPPLYTKRVDHIYESPNHYKSRRLLILGHSIFFRFIDGEVFSCRSSSLCCIQFYIIEYTAWMRNTIASLYVDMSSAHRNFTFRTFCLKLTTSKKKPINLKVLFDIRHHILQNTGSFVKKSLLKFIESSSFCQKEFGRVKSESRITVWIQMKGWHRKNI